MDYPRIKPELDQRRSVDRHDNLRQKIVKLRDDGHSLRFIAKVVGYKSHKDIMQHLSTDNDRKKYNLQRSKKRWQKIKADPLLYERQKEQIRKCQERMYQINPLIRKYNHERQKKSYAKFIEISS